MSIISDTYSPVKYYSYDEYGKQNVAGSSSFINDSTYTGAVSEGGNIFYMMARFYDANNGRFLTQDSYKGNAYEPMSQNLYSYVGNNPINYVDPTGHVRVQGTYSRYDGNRGMYCGVASTDIFSAATNFFDSDTGTSSASGSSDNGYFFADGTETTGFSEWNLRLNATERFEDDEGKALIGLFTKAGIQQLKGYVGVDLYGQHGDGDITVGGYGVLDLIVAKAKAAVAFDEDSFGIILEAKAAVASSRETIRIDIYGWSIEGGVYLEALTAGVKYQRGIFDAEYINEGNVGVGLWGGGYVFRVKPPEDWYK